MKLKISIIISVLFSVIPIIYCLILAANMDKWSYLTRYNIIFIASALMFYLGTWLWFCPSLVRFLIQLTSGIIIMVYIAQYIALNSHYLVGYGYYFIDKPYEYIFYGFYIAFLICALTMLVVVWTILTDKPKKLRKVITGNVQSRIVISVLFTSIFILFHLRMADTWDGWSSMQGHKSIVITAVLLFYFGTWIYFFTPLMRLLAQITAVVAIAGCMFRFLRRYTGFIYSEVRFLEGFYLLLFMYGLTALTGILIFLLDKQQRERMKELCRKNLTKKKILAAIGLTILVLSPIFIRRYKDYTYVSDDYSLTVVRNSFEIPIKDPDELLAVLEDQLRGDPSFADRSMILYGLKEAEKYGVVVKADYHGDGKRLLVNGTNIPSTITGITYLVMDKTSYIIIYGKENMVYRNAFLFDLGENFGYDMEFTYYLPLEERMRFGFGY